MRDFYRIRRLPPYVFEEVNKVKARLRGEGVDVIDFGMGNPDMATAPHIVDKLIETVKKPKTHGYSVSKGVQGLRKAMAGYYDRRYGVKLNPDTEVVATLGSKEGLANLAAAITSPGDTILVPNPDVGAIAYELDRGAVAAKGLTKSRFARLFGVICQLSASPTATFSICSSSAKATVAWTPMRPSMRTTSSAL